MGLVRTQVACPPWVRSTHRRSCKLRLGGSSETSHPGRPPVSALRARLNEDVIVRRIGKKTRHEDAPHVGTLFAFVGGLPETTTAGQARRFQAYQTAAGVGATSINSPVSACDLKCLNRT